MSEVSFQLIFCLARSCRVVLLGVALCLAFGLVQLTPLLLHQVKLFFQLRGDLSVSISLQEVVPNAAIRSSTTFLDRFKLSARWRPAEVSQGWVDALNHDGAHQLLTCRLVRSNLTGLGAGQCVFAEFANLLQLQHLLSNAVKAARCVSIWCPGLLVGQIKLVLQQLFFWTDRQQSSSSSPLFSAAQFAAADCGVPCCHQTASRCRFSGSWASSLSSSSGLKTVRGGRYPPVPRTAFS